MDGLLKQVHRYAYNEIRVLPLYSIIKFEKGFGCSCVLGDSCTSPGKHPRVTHGVNDATTDMEILSQWWGHKPFEPNIGLATGTCGDNYLTVLDLDGVEGLDSCRELFESLDICDAEHFENDFLRNYPYVKTGRGIHLYFQSRTCDGEIKSSAGKLGKGIDVRAEGGYVVAPPSKHLNGEYQWVNLNWAVEGASLFSSIPYLPLPLETVLRASPEPREVPWGEDEPIPQGERNAMLTSIGGKLRRLGFSKKEIASTLKEVNRERCYPPLEEGEVDFIAHSLSRYQPGEDVFDEEFSIIKKLDWDNPPSKPEWFLEGLIAKGDVVLVVGEPAAQKSWIAMSLAVSCVNNDSQWIDFPLKAGGDVIYVDEENQADEALRRLERLGFDPKFSGGKLHYYSQQQLRLDKNPAPLFQVIADIKPSLVVLDSLIRFHTEDESNNSAMAKLWNNGIMPISRRYGATTLILHHVNKTDDSKSFRRVRGAGDITAAVDLGLDVRVPHAGNYRHIKVFKPRHLVSVDDFYLRVEDVGSSTIVNRVTPTPVDQEVPF